jgi:hypothetical protein
MFNDFFVTAAQWGTQAVATLYFLDSHEAAASGINIHC